MFSSKLLSLKLKYVEKEKSPCFLKLALLELGHNITGDIRHTT